VLQLDDLNDPLSEPTGVGSAVSAVPQPEASPVSDGGWAGLMRLAAEFPLELLSFGGATDLRHAAPRAIVLPRPRSLCSDMSDQRVAALVDSAGDGPLIGLGAGMSLAGR
jgi:hypothetical protein